MKAFHSFFWATVVALLAVALSCKGNEITEKPEPTPAPEPEPEPQEEVLFGGGKGTVESPYLISSVKDLDTLAYLVNHKEGQFVSAIYSQTADIADASLKECIGNYAASAPFQGQYKGNGFSISGLQFESAPSQGAGLFGYADRATLSNIVIAGCSIEGSGSAKAAIVGISLKSTIKECSVSGEVNLGSGTACGAIAGNLQGGTISDCSFNGSLKGGNSTGGMAGLVSDGSITGCVVKGIITAAKGLGGIVGNADVPSGSSVSIDSCYNMADLTGTFNIGGILGYVLCKGTGTCVTNCVDSNNTIHGTEADTNYYARIGGIVGGTAKASTGPIDLLNCCSYNLKLKSTHSNTYVYGLSGIIGSHYCAGKISSCWTNILHSDFTTSVTLKYKGAIIGYKNAAATLASENYYNSANTYGAYYSTNTCEGLSDAAFTDGTLLGKLNEAAKLSPGCNLWERDSVTGLPLPTGEPAPYTDPDYPMGKIRILAIGNSFTVDAVEQYLSELLMAAGYDPIIGNCVIGGCTLQKHWENESSTVESTRNSNSYRKLVRGVKTTTENLSIATMLADEPWEYVIFQQGQGLYGVVDSHYPYIDNFKNYLKNYLQAGTYKIGYQMTWAFPKDCTNDRFNLYDKDQDKMYAACRDCAFEIQTRSNLDIIIPTGTAVQNGRTSSLGDTFNRDWGHLDYNHGRFTASCTWFETLTGLDVRDNTYTPTSVTTTNAGICRRAAHAAVADPKVVTQL